MQLRAYHLVVVLLAVLSCLSAATTATDMKSAPVQAVSWNGFLAVVLMVFLLAVGR